MDDLRGIARVQARRPGGSVAGFTRKDLYRACCLSGAKYWSADVVKAVDVVLERICQVLEVGGKADIKGLGRFWVHTYRARIIGVAPHMEGVGVGLFQLGGRWLRYVPERHEVKFWPDVSWGGEFRRGPAWFCTVYSRKYRRVGWQIDEDHGDGSITISYHPGGKQPSWQVKPTGELEGVPKVVRVWLIDGGRGPVLGKDGEVIDG